MGAVTTPSGEWFPCKATAPDGTEYRTCRVVAEAGRTVVYAWDRVARTGVVVIEAVGPPLELAPGPKSYGGRLLRNYVIEMDGDEVASFSEQGGCACSDPMKRWRPPAPRRAGT